MPESLIWTLGDTRPVSDIARVQEPTRVDSESQFAGKNLVSFKTPALINTESMLEAPVVAHTTPVRLEVEPVLVTLPSPTLRPLPVPILAPDDPFTLYQAQVLEQLARDVGQVDMPCWPITSVRRLDLEYGEDSYEEDNQEYEAEDEHGDEEVVRSTTNSETHDTRRPWGRPEDYSHPVARREASVDWEDGTTLDFSEDTAEEDPIPVDEDTLYDAYHVPCDAHDELNCLPCVVDMSELSFQSEADSSGVQLWHLCAAGKAGD